MGAQFQFAVGAAEPPRAAPPRLRSLVRSKHVVLGARCSLQFTCSTCCRATAVHNALVPALWLQSSIALECATWQIRVAGIPSPSLEAALFCQHCTPRASTLSAPRCMLTDTPTNDRPQRSCSQFQVRTETLVVLLTTRRTLLSPLSSI